MAFSSHIVQELHLDLTVSERQKAFSIQQRASQLASNRLIGALERILSRYADDQLVFQIDKLEVDIGRLMEENWEEHFLQLLQIRLDKELKNRLQYIPGEAVQAQVLEKEERNLEAWFFLLEKGYLPWWAQHSEKSINEKEVLAALVGNTTKQVLLKELCKEAPIYRRLVFHYSDHFLTKLMEILYHSIPKQLEEFKVIIIAYVQAKEPSSLKRNLTRFRLWKHILERVVDGKIEASAQRIDTTRLLLAKMSIKPKHLLNWIDFSLYKGNKSLGSTDSLKFWQEMFLELSKVDNPSSPNHLAFQTEKGELDQPTTNPPLLPDLPEQVAEEPTSLKENRDKEEIPEVPEIGTTSFSSGEKTKEGWEVEEDHPERLSIPWRKETTSPGTSIYIQHAGLILLNPFFPQLFSELNLYEGKAFLSRETQIQAIHLLHFIAAGDSKITEPELVLPKVLSAYPVSSPIPIEDSLVQQWKEEADTMMKAALNQWGVLKNASPDGLREGFLQREGKLTRKKDGWHLQIEKMTLDVLLARLPFGWGISIVKLPWMKNMLTIDWI